MLTYLAIADRFRPKWIVWENVPGVLSSNSGRDFGTFLGALVELGYGFAYRVLDAQYVGGPRAVPQRRRRVFVVACLGDWRAAAEVLSIGEGLRGYLAKGRAKGQGFAAGPEGGVDANHETGFDTNHERLEQDTKLKTQKQVEGNGGEKIFGSYSNPNTAFTLETTSHDWSLSDQMTMIIKPAEPNHVPFRKSKRAQSTTDNETWVPADTSNTLNNFDLGDTRTTHAVIEASVYENHAQDSRVTGPLNVAPTVAAKFGTGGGNVPLVGAMTVRRLTCVETERLQGFPDNWSRIPWKGKPEEQCPDGPRYKACGNSMAVPCMFWIGEQISNYENKL